jgi:hypothetical protein
MAEIMEDQQEMQPKHDHDTTEKPSDAEDTSQMPTGLRLITIIASVLLAMFLVALV